MSSPNGMLAARIVVLIRERLHIDVASTDTDLLGGGLLDSLALVELLFEIEREFGVEIPVDRLEPEQLATAEALAATVLALQPAPERRSA